MKNFVKLIQQIHEERFSVVMNKLVTKKIPVVFLSIAPIAQATELAKNFDLNPPPPHATLNLRSYT